MHTNPFVNAAQGRPLSKDEFRLEVVAEPAVDYFALVDRLIPPYTPPVVNMPRAAGVNTAVAISNEVLRERMVASFDEDAEPTMHVLGHRRYFRAIDPCGNLCQLTVGSGRPDADNPSGRDEIYETRQITGKNRRGWLIVEKDPATWSPFAPYRENAQQYAAWCLAVMALRKKKYDAHNLKETRAIMDSQLALAREKAVIEGEVIAGAVTQAVTLAVAQATAAATAAVQAQAAQAQATTKKSKE